LSNSGTGTRITTELGIGNRTVQQIIDNITAPSGKKEKRHHLKHWLHYLETNGTIEKVSGTKWHNATWGLV
jgi:hypothetical protein